MKVKLFRNLITAVLMFMNYLYEYEPDFLLERFLGVIMNMLDRI